MDDCNIEMTVANEDILQKLARSIVEIISDKEEVEEDSSTLGTGFVVTDDGLVVTCRHVVTDSDDKLMNTVKARFYSDFIKADGTRDRKKGVNIDSIPKYSINLVKEYTRDISLDLAFFKLNITSIHEQNKKLTPVELDDKALTLNDFMSIGFKKAHMFRGLSAYGSIGILTRKDSRDGLLSPEVIELHHNKKIQPGMSGAPVFDVKRNRVVGIITERYNPIDYDDEEFALALPVKSMIDLCPSLREQNQGLTVLSKFLRAIGEEETSIYKWIDEVYVPPNEYEEIKAALRRDRIVFITGTKEFGKTFTAVKLMYEFFKEDDSNNNKGNGYTPRWIRAGKEPGREGADPRELLKLENENYIKPREIVYVEDPFGKTSYERSSELEHRVGSIIDSINSIQDAYVIITSREEVFKEFKREQLSARELANFEKKMNLKRASYDSEKRKEMLLRWAKVNNCRWLLDPALRELVLKTIENQQFLPTPLNIRDFVKASHDLLDFDQLKGLIEQKSQETARQFADEIIRMEEDEKVLFLAFPYVADGRLDMDTVKRLYQSILADTKESNQKYFIEFEGLKGWFEGDKINISDNKLAFSHPSYHEAFRYAVSSEKRHSDRINTARIRDILSSVLLRLIHIDEATWGVAYTVSYNFDKLPPNVQQLLFKLADNDEAAGSVAEAIADNFNNLPPNVQQLLFKLADNDKAVVGVATAIARNFNNLPPNVQQLLFKLADNDNAAFGGVYGVALNFNNLPPNVQQLLFKLADNDSTAEDVALFAVKLNFDQLPPNIREQLLLKLADRDAAAWDVADAIAEKFDQLPPNIREQLLIKLADNDKAVVGVATAIARNFNNLPPNVQQLLFKLADNDKAAVVIKDLSDNLREDIRRELLTKLNKKKHHVRIWRWKW